MAMLGKLGMAIAIISFALFSFAAAQSRRGIPLIGILEPGRATNVCNDGLRQGLRGLGYIDGQNLRIETRYAQWNSDRLRHFADELASLRPSLLWTHSLSGIRALQQTTTTIPIILGVSRNLIELGIVSSLARPGGNITGMDLRDSDIIGKRLELTKQAVPKISRVAVLADPNDSGHAAIPQNMEEEGRVLRVQLQRMEVKGPEAFEKVFAAITRDRADALILPESAMFSQHREHIFKIATSKRVPTAAGGSHFAEAGALISYGANIMDVCQRSALLADKVLRGATPADLPVERPVKFELVINLKTAKQIGLTIPPNVLARADRVIR
ncbi:MAG TPA: ABC transporter substrate-binding protein [Candidatus Binatia bacterium]|nr:ABC transporter substrate-binding protein [Candidatus Binatia bacterium]